jgi:hypothetical protein
MKTKVISEHSIEDWAQRTEILQIFSMPHKNIGEYSIVVAVPDAVCLGLLSLVRKDLLGLKANIIESIDIAFNNLEKGGSKQTESLN